MVPGTSPVTRVILIGAAGVVAVDTIAALLLLWLGGSWAWTMIAEGLVYLAVGFAAGRPAGVGAGARSGAAVAAVDSTVGWAVASAIGPGRVSRVTVAGVAFVVLFMVMTGAIAGAVGAWAARRLRHRPPRSTVAHLSR
jgi:hypothetical protein